jgi:putative hydrolase of the HAD superfamily
LVFFDAGETLVHPAPSFPELFTRVVTDAGHTCEPQDVDAGLTAIAAAFTDAARADERWTTSLERSQRFWTRLYRTFLEAAGLPTTGDLPERLYAVFTDPGNYAAFTDVLPTLRELQETGRDLGLISNFEVWLDDLLLLLGLTPFFPVRIISGIEGIEKPSPEIFELALERAGIEPHEAIYVGDSPDMDVAPAAAIGMLPVLIDRRGRHPDHPGLRIEDLRDLPGVLDLERA